MNINIIEGMDYVGKGAYINTFKAVDPNAVVYHADYSEYDKVFDRRLTKTC